MKLEELIKNKFGSIENLTAQTDKLSRAYIYKLIQGTMSNPSKDVLKELSRLLELPVEKIIELIDETEEI